VSRDSEEHFERASKLSKVMTKCWVSFMRSGDPSHGEIHWPEFGEDSETIVFDHHECIVERADEEVGSGINHMKKLRRKKSGSVFGVMHYETEVANI